LSYLRTDLGVRCQGMSRDLTGNPRTKGVLQWSTHNCANKNTKKFLLFLLKPHVSTRFCEHPSKTTVDIQKYLKKLNNKNYKK
jgi:hypothetical protein